MMGEEKGILGVFAGNVRWNNDDVVVVDDGDLIDKTGILCAMG
jgi:hypothetical protein